MIVAGIDPGKSGGLGIIGPGLALGLNVPILKASTEPDWELWASSWGFALSEADPALIVIESVGSMPAQGVRSVFTFGETLGYVHGIAQLACPRARFEWPSPSKWKAKMGLTSNKVDSLSEARRIFPAARDALKRVKDNGVAEGLLLAEWGRLYVSR